MTDSILADLNDVQRAIVTDCDGPMLVLAGAGSGKTRAVTHKIAYLLKVQHLMPYRVLSVTFTNKAAAEMRERVKKLAGPPASGLELGTFHSVCARLLRRHAELLGHTSSFVIYDTDDAGVLMRQIVKDHDLDPKKFNPKRLASTFDTLRSHNVALDEWTSDGQWDRSWRNRAAELFRAYEKRKQQLDAMDFTDLLHKMHRLLADHPDVRQHYQERFEYVMVDEMQDTNHVQLELLKLLVGDHNRICAVGDDDQSIYGWRGARVENMLSFETAFAGAKILRMEQNYRSTQTILAAAHSVIQHNDRRHSKKLWTENPQGEPLQLVEADTEGDEAKKVAAWILRLQNDEKIPARDMAVFFRTNAQSRSFEEVFAMERIPYIVVGGMRFYERAEVKDALGYLRLVQNTRDEVSLMRIFNRPTRGIGDKAMQRLRELAYDNGTSLYDAALSLIATPEPERWHKPVVAFVKQVESWRQLATTALVSDLLMKVLEESGYVARLETLDTVEGESRLENLQQLVAGIVEQEGKVDQLTLQDYLEQIALITDIDSWSEDREHVPLMTVHAAKGLEFDVVFASGMEEGLFPHQNHTDPAEIEEERRLFYVALTRARKRVVLSHAKSRVRFGQWEYMRPSRFIGELDPDLVVAQGTRPRGSFRDAMGRSSQPSVHRRRPSRESIGVREATAGARRSGQRVRHAKFGDGKVLAAVGKQLVVKFDDGTLVTVLAEAVTTLS
jgi:DNA helicase-2/ATP-dependent DNA helicase PcrA